MMNYKVHKVCKVVKLLFALGTLCFINFPLASAQNKWIDSLRTLLKTEKEDTNKVNTLDRLTRELYNTNRFDSAMLCAARERALAEKLGFKKGLATSFCNIAYTFWCESKYPGALENYNIALGIDHESGDKKGAAGILGDIGLIYYELGNYPKAIEYQFKALAINKEIGNKQYMLKNLGNLGIIYDGQGNYAKALEYYNESINIEKEIGDSIGLSADYCNMGNVYEEQGNYAKALEYNNNAYIIALKKGDKYGISASLNDIGGIYASQANEAQTLHLTKKRDSLYKIALDDFYTVLNLNRKIGNTRSLSINWVNIGSIYTKQGKFNLAKSYLDSSLWLAKKIANKELIKTAYSYQAFLDSINGNFKKGLEDYKNYILYRDSLVNEENTKKTVQEEMNYEFNQKQAAEKAEQDKKDAVAASDKRRQNIVIVSISIGLALVLLFSVLLLNRFRITQQQKKIIEEQKQIVEEKNKDITDSIHYASRIQRALLTTDGYIGKHLPEHFILFKPKDIVSGDFYWAYATPHSAFLLCAGDCTGHGVPGAFMSLLNISMLNETTIEKKIHSPAAILDDVREHIIKALNPEGKDTGSKDGMDCVLCSFDFANNKLNFACANNPLWIVRAHAKPLPIGGDNKVLPIGEDLGGAELIEFKPDKMPVGVQGEKNIPFTLQSTPLQKGDLVYIFTDGYADQFGGPKGKKFKYKALQEKLLAISRKPLTEQRNILNDTFEQWKDNLDQVDDVLVIGIRV